MGRTRRENTTARRPPSREPRSRILIVCGGLRTEKLYFDALRKWRHNPAVRVTVLPKGSAPSGLVTYARKWLRQRSDSFDEVWCVFDVDNFPHIAEAVRLATQEMFSVAVSNPCFELWLLLHFEQHTAYLSGYNSVRSRLGRHLADYDKTAPDLALLRGGVDDAVRRARELEPTGEAFEVNPSTGVWRLVERVWR